MYHVAAFVKGNKEMELYSKVWSRSIEQTKSSIDQFMHALGAISNLFIRSRTEQQAAQ